LCVRDPVWGKYLPKVAHLANKEEFQLPREDALIVEQQWAAYERLLNYLDGIAYVSLAMKMNGDDNVLSDMLKQQTDDATVVLTLHVDGRVTYQTPPTEAGDEPCTTDLTAHVERSWVVRRKSAFVDKDDDDYEPYRSGL